MPLSEPGPACVRWFSSRGSVLQRGESFEVFVGGTLIGSFDATETLERNAILVQLAEDPKAHLGKLADAFDISPEWLRQLRQRYAEGGLEALRPKESGGQNRLGERDTARLERFFDAGLGPSAAHAKLKRGSLSTATRLHRAWKARAERKSPSAPTSESAEARTMTLPGMEMLPTVATAAEAAGDSLQGGAFVQHVGTWIMIAMLARLGLYGVARKVGEGRVSPEALRVGLDAAVATFTIGEPTLEGVRRLRTPTATLLLQSAYVPTPDSLRELMDARPKVNGSRPRRRRLVASSR